MKPRKHLAVSLSALLCLGLSACFTQTEDTTPEPVEENTPVPETAEPEPTEEVTPEPTPEATPESTPEATPEPTPTPTPETLGGLSDDELIALAQDKVEDIWWSYFYMSAGQFPDIDWNSSETVGDDIYYLVKEVSSMDELEDAWYAKFSRIYTIEQVAGAGCLDYYKEIDGKLYSAAGGVGNDSGTLTVKGIKEKNDNEVVFTGTNADDSTLEFSMVYEDGTWKYGYFGNHP